MRLLLRREILARLGGISPTTLHRLTRAGQFPAAPTTVGGQSAWPEDVVDDAIRKIIARGPRDDGARRAAVATAARIARVAA